MHTQQILMLVHKFMYHKYCLPCVFSNCFELNIDVHKYDTRGSNCHCNQQQEAQLMLTTGSTRLAVSRGQQTWYHSTCYI